MKDSSKNKEWERRRRDRLNDAFKKLAQILPNYDPAAKTPKIDILEKAAQFIKELRLSNSRLISQQTQNDEKSKLINELQDESNKLILRVKQLTALLKQAKIRIPLGPSLKIGKKQGKWSNQLTPENVENSTMSSAERNSNDEKKDTSANITQDKDGPAINAKSVIPANPQSVAPTNGTPLKETNTDKECATSVTAPKTTEPQIPNIPPIIKPIVQSVPLPTTTTIILTSCPIPNPLANQPVVTRMTIAPRILPKPDETSHLQKIAILPIRKALPPKEKKRRNRAKKVKVIPEEPVKISKATNTLPVVPKEGNVVTTSTSSDTCTQSPVKVVKDKIKDITKNKEKNETSKGSQKELPEIIDLTDDKSNDSAKVKDSKDRHKNNAKKSIPCPLSKKKVCSPKSVSENKNKGTRENVSEKPKRIVEEDKQTTPIEKITETIPEVSGEDAEKILQSDNMELESSSSKENQNSNKINRTESEKTAFDESPSKKSTEIPEIVARVVPSLQINQLEDLQEAEETVEPPTTVAVEVPSESLREEESTPMDVTENEETVENGNDNDKISECIARSIDLIDPPVGELMELSGDWGEAHSPKSPISPTQMFLSMFPLLPRDSIVNASENQSSTCKTSMQFSSVRSSFFIDAMLPEENSNNTETISANSNNTLSRNSSGNPPSNPNTNVSSNSSSNFITSTYNSLVGTTCLAVAPTPAPQRQETSHFHNLESLNFMSMAPTSTFQSHTVSPPKKSSNINPIHPLNDFRSRCTPGSISNPTSTANPMQPNSIPTPVSETSQYKNQNFSQYSSYIHSQPNQQSRQTIPPTVPASSQNSNSPNVVQQPNKKISQNKNSLNSSISSSTPTNSKASSVSTPHVESSTPSSIPIARVTQYQPQTPMSTSDSQNIFRNISTTTHGHSTIPIPAPTPTPNHHHANHHHPYQNPTFHQNPQNSTSARNSRESSKTQNYQNSYTGENSSNLPQPHSNTNAKPQKSQIFRPGLTDFNMSARMHTQIHQETSTAQHSQNYPTNDSSNNHQSKSHVSTSAAVTYSTTTNNSLNPLLNSGNHHNQSNYPSISNMLPQQPNLQRNSNQTTQNQSNTKTHSHSASNSNVSKQQRQYSHSSELSGNFTVRPPQQQNQNETPHPPTPSHSSNTNNKSQSQSQHQQSHSHRSGSQSQNQSQNPQQQHHGSRNQSTKGISSTSTQSNNNPGSISSRNSNNPPENSFHLDFSSVIPTPVPISAQPVPPSLVQISNRNRSNNSSSHPAPISNPLQIGPTIPPPTPIPDFAPSPAMNFNQYHHHDPNIHSSTPNYFPIRHSAPPTTTASRATPFYLQEVHSSESLPILPHTPLNNHNANTSSLQSQNQSNNINNNSKNNFNPPAPPPVYSHPTHSHHNKNYFLDHTQGHSLYQHSLNNPPQPHLQSEAPPTSLVAPPVPPPIYSHPVHTPHVSHRHQQNCNVGPTQHQNQTQSNLPRPQQHQQPNKSHSSNKQTNQTQSNQTHYPVQNSSSSSNTNNSNCSSNQQRPNQNASNNNSNIAVPQPQPNNNSSRPVNWMTDPPHRKPAPVVNNPFSVSKLVGNSSFVANNSYCAEALIRKNPEWNDFHFTPPTPTIAPPPPPQHSHPPHTFVPYQAQNEHPAYSNFTHQYTPNPSASHFGHFDNTQQHHHHHHNHLPHHHATTSSVSNFNLSSIFPEINDKRNNSNNTSSTNANSNPQDSNTNRCNYYSGKITK